MTNMLINYVQAHTLAHLQSITIVFLKIILTNVSAVVNQANSQAAQSMRYLSDIRAFRQKKFPLMILTLL